MKEKLEQYAFLAQIISAAAIVVSLVFVGMQVRLGAQETAANSEAIRGQVRESMLAADQNVLLNLMDYPYLIDQSWPLQTAPVEQQQRARLYFVSMMRSRENYWNQHQAGLLDDDTYQSYREPLLIYLMGNDFYLDMWKANTYLPQGFKDEINAYLHEAGRLP